MAGEADSQITATLPLVAETQWVSALRIFNSLQNCSRSCRPAVCPYVELYISARCRHSFLKNAQSLLKSPEDFRVGQGSCIEPRPGTGSAEYTKNSLPGAIRIFLCCSSLASKCVSGTRANDYTLLRYARGVTPNLATNCRLKFELLSNPHSVPIDDTARVDSLNIAQACAQRTSLT